MPASGSAYVQLLIQAIQQNTAHLMVACCFKGRVAVQELVRQHAQAPHVHAAAVLTPLHHLWRQVVQGAAQRLAPAAQHNSTGG